MAFLKCKPIFPVSENMWNEQKAYLMIETGIDSDDRLWDTRRRSNPRDCVIDVYRNSPSQYDIHSADIPI